MLRMRSPPKIATSGTLMDPFFHRLAFPHTTLFRLRRPQFRYRRMHVLTRLLSCRSNLEGTAPGWIKPDSPKDIGFAVAGSLQSRHPARQHKRRCLLWVMSRHRVTSASCLSYPSKSHSSARFVCPLSANTGRSWYALLAPAAHATSPVPPAPPVPAMQWRRRGCS